MNTPQNLSSTPPEQPAPSLAPPPSVRLGQWWVVALLGVLIFIAGGVLGSGLTLRFLRDRVLYAIHHPQEVPARLSVELKGRLGLTNAETEKVRQIIARHQLDLQKIRREVQPQVERELEELRKEVADALTPEQAAKWNAWLEQMRTTWLPPAPPPPQEQP